MPQKSKVIRGSGPLKTKFNLPGIKKLLLPRPADTDSMGTSVPARALFGPAAGNGSGRNNALSTTEKIAVFAPMPSASVRTATRVNPGDLRSWRKASFKSFMSLSAQCLNGIDMRCAARRN